MSWNRDCPDVYGGCVQNWPRSKKQNAETYLRLKNHIDYVAMSGNHDIGRSNATYFHEFFGSYDKVVTTERIVFVLMSWTAADGAAISTRRLYWADNVIANNQDKYVIFATHGCLNWTATKEHPEDLRISNSNDVYARLTRHSNVIATLSGHGHENQLYVNLVNGREIYVIDTGVPPYVTIFDVYEDWIFYGAIHPIHSAQATHTRYKLIALGVLFDVQQPRLG